MQTGITHFQAVYEMIARHLLIRGKVQGVFYRAWTQHNARALGVTGWVRNRADGTVEAIVQGEPARVEELVRRCWQGPPAATVQDIRVEDVEPQPSAGFQVRSAPASSPGREGSPST